MKNNMHISSTLFFLLAFMLLMLPLQWCFAMILAALWHELCHYWAVKCCGAEVYQIRFTPVGAKMESTPMPPGKEMFCALAGPFGGLMLLLLARWMPRTALCAGMQSLYNLLPISGLDGGTALRCAAAMLFPKKQADTICRWTELIIVAAFLILGIYGSVIKKLGLLPIIVAVFLAIRTQNGKFPCKQQSKALQ